MSPFTTKSRESVSQTGEKALIRRVIATLADAAPAPPEGPGDDCATLDDSSRRGLRIVTADPVIHGRHFDDFVAPGDAGKKLVRRNVSDIAAMGGTPTDATLALLVAPNVAEAWLLNFIEGVAEACRECGVRIVGGDIARMPEGVFAATLSLTGFAEKPMTRTGARTGDFLYVTGVLGGSILGKHFAFNPRVAEGLFLAKHPAVRAGMDISDGLAKDARALLPANAAAMIALAALPLSPDAHRLAARTGKSAAHHAIADGEDYELLVVVASEGAEALEKTFAQNFPDTPFTLIGRIVPAAGLEAGSLHDESGAAIPETGFDHFG